MDVVLFGCNERQWWKTFWTAKVVRDFFSISFFCVCVCVENSHFFRGQLTSVQREREIDFFLRRPTARWRNGHYEPRPPPSFTPFHPLPFPELRFLFLLSKREREREREGWPRDDWSTLVPSLRFPWYWITISLKKGKKCFKKGGKSSQYNCWDPLDFRLGQVELG